MKVSLHVWLCVIVSLLIEANATGEKIFKTLEITGTTLKGQIVDTYNSDAPYKSVDFCMYHLGKDIKTTKKTLDIIVSDQNELNIDIMTGLNRVYYKVCVAEYKVGMKCEEENENNDQIFCHHFGTIPPPKMLKIMNECIQLSHEYLYLGFYWGSINHQKSGLSKYLRDLSDIYWNVGIKILRKYHELGGIITTNYATHFDFEIPGCNDNQSYEDVFYIVGQNSMKFARNMNDLINKAKNNGAMKNFVLHLLEEEAEILKSVEASRRFYLTIIGEDVAKTIFDDHLKL